jgi:hypothetical protein
VRPNVNGTPDDPHQIGPGTFWLDNGTTPSGQAEATRAQEAERWRDFSVSTDVEATRPLPDIRF